MASDSFCCPALFVRMRKYELCVPANEYGMPFDIFLDIW